MQSQSQVQTVWKAYQYHVKPGVVHEDDFWYFRDLREDSVFLDVGANLGLSINSLTAVGARPQIHAFEPNPVLWPVLIEVLRSYNAPSSLHLFGLSDRNGVLDLYVPYVDQQPIWGEASVDLAHFDEPLVASRLVSYGTLGSLNLHKTSCRLHRLDELGLRPTHIKLDIEGHELSALRGMRHTLMQQSPVLLVEGGWNTEILSYLGELGYLAQVYNSGTGTLEPLRDTKPLNVFFIRRC